MARVQMIGDDLGDTSFTGRISTTSDMGTFAANTDYTLTFDAARNQYVASGNWFVVGGLRADGDDVAAIDQDIRDLTDGSTTGEEDTFYPVTVSFSTADNPDVVGDPISIFLGFRHEDDHNTPLYFDNVQLDASPIPEPATMSLLAVGALFALRRRSA